MRKIEKVVSIATSALVGTFGMLALYTAHGPVLSEPVVLTVPDGVMSMWCGEAWGCYQNALPDLIVLSETGAKYDATLPHEMLHYTHPEWSECEVSNHLYATTGLTDGYWGTC